MPRGLLVRATCSGCGRDITLREDGRIRGHGPAGNACPGSGFYPASPPLTIGIDWWNVASHHAYFLRLARAHLICGDKVLIISAIGPRRRGTIEAEARSAGFSRLVPVHEVIFTASFQAPELKLNACRALGVSVFYDDRQDVCDLLAEAGILAMRVPRKSRQPDLAAERA
jgi:hypothetical protein